MQILQYNGGLHTRCLYLVSITISQVTIFLKKIQMKIQMKMKRINGTMEKIYSKMVLFFTHMKIGKFKIYNLFCILLFFYILSFLIVVFCKIYRRGEDFNF